MKLTLKYIYKALCKNKKLAYATVALGITMSVGMVSVFNFVSASGEVEKPVLEIEKAVAYNAPVKGEAEVSKQAVTTEEIKNVASAPAKDAISLQHASAVAMNVNRDLDAPVLCHQLCIDGKAIANFESREDAINILDNIKASFAKEDENTEVLSVNIVENTKVLAKAVSVYDFDGYADAEQVEEYIRLGTNEKREYTVVSGDTISEIAKRHSMKEDDLYAANPELHTQKYLQIDQKLNLIVPVPLLSVETVERIIYKEAIPYKVTEEPTSKLYKGEKSIKIRGVKGQIQRVADVQFINGIKVDKTIVSENVVSEPKTQVLWVGTKQAPPRIGTGKFSKPTSRSYRVTSPFGVRRRTGMHKGIDMAMPTGSPVLAADGGRVVFSGYKGTYGRLVVINHGGRLKSYYAHCSKLLVKSGDKVFKGQKIALSGNTGRSTGPHLHFEIRLGNTPVNPRKYVGI